VESSTRVSQHVGPQLQKNKWPMIERGGLALHVSPLLSKQSGLIHAFTTRLGGDSRAPMEWFNLGRHIDDQAAREDAIANRKRLCQALALDYDKIVVPGQVHSNIVVSSRQNDFAQVDSIATTDQGRPILLHFADCVPIIIFDPHVRALVVVHAGWKGTAGCIAKNAVRFLGTEFGCRPEHLVAAVGPAIGSCCYPVSEETAQALGASVSNDSGLIVRRSKPHPDLKAINAVQLKESGVGAIDVTDLCTACQPELFYSHRQSGGKTGRQGAIASINYIS